MLFVKRVREIMILTALHVGLMPIWSMVYVSVTQAGIRRTRVTVISVIMPVSNASMLIYTLARCAKVLRTISLTVLMYALKHVL